MFPWLLSLIAMSCVTYTNVAVQGPCLTSVLLQTRKRTLPGLHKTIADEQNGNTLLCWEESAIEQITVDAWFRRTKRRGQQKWWAHSRKEDFNICRLFHQDSLWGMLVIRGSAWKVRLNIHVIIMEDGLLSPHTSLGQTAHFNSNLCIYKKP